MLKFAFLNLFRYRKRTIITAIAIGVGIFVGIFSQSLLDGVDAESNRNLIWYETSSMKIFDESWYADKDVYPINHLIDSSTIKGVESSLKDNDINNYTKEFLELADVSFYEDPYPSTGSIKAILHAIDLSTPSAYRYDKSTIKGEWISPNSEGVVIGSKAAEDMGSDIGYYITIQTKGNGGFLQAFDVPIIGIINTGNPIIDSTSLFFDYNFINDILELDGSYSSIAISLGNSVSTSIKESNKMLPLLSSIASSNNLEVHNWDDIAKEIMQLAQSKSGGSTFIIFFLFLIAIVGVTNTMVMAISERKNEVAMLKTLGYTNLYIKVLFSIEGALIGVFGAIIGAIIGISSSLYFSVKGIDFSAIGSDLDFGYRINTIMYSDINYTKVLFICLLAILFCTLAAYLAVRNATKGEIADQMRKI
jgi:ABC-type lipoprotein release transport system permease subunit